MRNRMLVLALLAALVVPGTAVAATDTCSVDIAPSVGTPTDVFRITVSNVPVDPDGDWVHGTVQIRRLGSREGSIFFLTLVPGATQFYVDYNEVYPEEPPLDPLEPGRYLVLASIDDPVPGCHAVGQFRVV